MNKNYQMDTGFESSTSYVWDSVQYIFYWFCLCIYLEICMWTTGFNFAISKLGLPFHYELYNFNRLDHWMFRFILNILKIYIQSFIHKTVRNCLPFMGASWLFVRLVVLKTLILYFVFFEFFCLLCFFDLWFWSHLYN